MNQTPLLVTRLNREIPKVGHVCYVCRKKYSNPSVPKLELLTVVSICSIFFGGGGWFQDACRPTVGWWLMLGLVFQDGESKPDLFSARKWPKIIGQLG